MSLLNESYNDIIAEFGEEKIRQRYCSIVERANNFIIAYGFQDIAYVSDNNVVAMITDYFTDILRIKRLHNIKKVNKTKIIAYTAYWVLRRRVIQISENDASVNSTYINEKFILSYIIDELISGFKPDRIPSDGNYSDFVNLLYYYLKYRNYDPQSIELMIMSFIAGITLVSNDKEVDVSGYSIVLCNENE